MPTPQNLKRFFAKRHIEVLGVETLDDGFALAIKSGGDRALEIWAQTSEPSSLHISELNSWATRLSPLTGFWAKIKTWIGKMSHAPG